MTANDSPQSTTTNAQPFLDVIGIHKRFGGVHALRGVSLAIMPGEIYHLLGENGCGKSTLIKIISGAQPPDSGDLIVAGRRYQALKPLESLAAGIETVYQDLSLIPNLSVAENVALTEQLVATGGRLLKQYDRAILAQTATHALEAVGLPSDADFRATPVELLPIATRQLVAIARAIATKARMVIMDEPTTALTQREVDNLIRVINGLRASGVAVLFVSHKLDECYAIGGQVIILRDGEKVAQGPITDYTKAQLMQLMTGKQLDGRRYRTGTATGEIVLKAQHLGATGGFEDVSFELRRGEILGLTGLLDSGRNELALALAGVSPADQGELLIDNEAQNFKTPADAIAKGIGYVPEDRLSEGLFLDKPIRDNVVTAVLNRLRGRFGMLDASKGDGLAEHTIKDLQIAAPNIMLPVQSLSGGNQQRVLIGRWLAIEPRVLVLHGPTVGVDVGSKDTIYRIVQRLAENGLAVLIISDDLPELLQNCDRILLMRKGHLAGEYAAANLEEAALYRALVGEESMEVAA
jgi:simple sugar transport system ATP-binding protein